MAAELLDRLRDAAFALTSCLCAPSSTIKLNGRSFKIVKLLGEGGFSYVYLAEDESSGRRFALKKIRCPLGTESLHQAMEEVSAYRRFRHPNLIRCLDSAVVQEQDGKIVYLFLPLYQRGNLQDAISANAVNGSRFPERDMLNIFLGTCLAVRAMHDYVAGPAARYPPGDASSPQMAGPPSSDAQHGEEEDELNAHPIEQPEAPLISRLEDAGVVEEHDDGHMPGIGDDDGAPVVGKLDPRVRPAAASGERQPWAHRDIKPGNVMLADDGKQPILMDFGSAVPARLLIKNRSMALAEQDRAGEHSTMPYRAPELFDVKAGSTLDEKVDIWSLGCLLFACAYGYSPFETPEQQEHGGSINMAVLNGSWRFPNNDTAYSQGLRDLVSSMLVVDPQKRPDIHAVIASTRAAIARLQ